jgi:hypothetical protein
MFTAPLAQLLCQCSDRSSAASADTNGALKDVPEAIA